MGYDLYGKNAKNEKGEYFRNNVWWWKRLWQFVCIECENIMTKEEIEAGESNSGIEITQKTKEKIIKILKESIKNNNAKEFKEEINEEIKKAKENNKNYKMGDKNYNYAELYPFSIENLKDFIKFLENNESFTIN